jgi:hypothetical protein
MWTGAHLADIESDMSVFHRVDDIWAMPPARFFMLAYRLPAYRGAMREVALAEQRDREPEGRPVAARPTAAPAPRAPAASNRPVTKAALHDPAFKGIFSFE